MSEQEESAALLFDAQKREIGRLVAQRDELLEALEDWERLECRRSKKNTNTVFVDIRDWEAFKARTRAAIAKANGGQP